jgi:hypothetical protein
MRQSLKCLAVPLLLASAPAGADGAALVAHPLDGPFASPQAFCDALALRPGCVEISEAVSPAGPWRSLRLLSVTTDRQGSEVSARLALETDDGWMVTRPLDEPGLFARLQGARVEPALAPRGGVAVRFVNTWFRADSERPSARWETRCSERVVLCAVGISQAPSCTPAIDLRDAPCGPEGVPAGADTRTAAAMNPTVPTTWESSFELRVLGPGRVELRATPAPPVAKINGQRGDEAPGPRPPCCIDRRLLGRHRVVFP